MIKKIWLLGLVLLPIAGVQAGLWNPAVINGSFEDPIVKPDGAVLGITDWFSTGTYTYTTYAASSPGEYPRTTYGDNWAEFGNAKWMYQQIGTWQAEMQLEVSFLMGRRDSKDFIGVYVRLWAGGNPASAADDVLPESIGAVMIAESPFIQPALAGNETSEQTVTLSTGTGYTAGDPLWLEFSKTSGNSRTFIDNVNVTLKTIDPAAVNPTPPENAYMIDPLAQLKWDYVNANDPNFILHIGTDENCNDILADHNNGSNNTFSPSDGLLQPETAYYWRIDIVEDGQTYIGNVWTFTTAPQLAPVTVDTIREDFIATGIFEIDGIATPETPIQTESNNGHTFTWGACQLPDKAVGISLNGDTDELHFANGNPGTYAYTVFDSTGSNMPDTAVDLSGPAATIEAGKTGGSDGWTLKFMIRDGNGNWYIADTDMTGSNTTLILNIATDGPDDGPVTWTAVDERNGTLNLLTAGDEKLLVLTNSGLSPDLSMVTGGGIYCTNYGGADTKQVSHISWVKEVPPGKPTNPLPADGATAATTQRYLRWKGSLEVASYDVYFGTTGDLVFVGNFTETSVHFASLATALSQTPLPEGTYQWQINSLDEAGQIIEPGDIWTVTIPPNVALESIAIEDFTTYMDTNDLRTRWASGPGADVQLDDWFGSMNLSYKNHSPGVSSETTFATNTLTGWTYDNMKSLSLSFKGNTDNSTQPLYIKMSDGNLTVKVVYPEPEAVNIDQWAQWDIKLSAFTEAGLNPATVTSLIIGIGEGDNAGPGSVLIDDIALYPSRCLEAYRSPADVNGDCMVNLTDLMLIANEWLYSDYDITAVTPAANMLLAHYSFDPGLGVIAYDISGNENNATIDPAGVSGYRSNEGIESGKCLKIEADLKLTLPAEIFGALNTDLTIALWTKAQDDTDITQFQFGAGTAPGENELYDWDYAKWNTSDITTNQWNHWAMVKRFVNNSIQLFCNGILVDLNDETTEQLAANLAGETVITADPNGSPIYIDDLRLYATALSHEEIVALAAQNRITQPINPLLTENDPNKDGSIDMNDLAIIADQWLLRQDWPR